MTDRPLGQGWQFEVVQDEDGKPEARIYIVQGKRRECVGGVHRIDTLAGWFVYILDSNTFKIPHPKREKFLSGNDALSAAAVHIRAAMPSEGTGDDT